MSGHRTDPRDAQTVSAPTLLSIAAAAASRAPGGPGATFDLMLGDEHRLDEQTRFAAHNRLDAVIGAVEREIRDHASRLLQSRDATALVGALEAAGEAASMLRNSAALRDSGLIEEILAAVRLELIGAALPVEARDDADEESLLARLVQAPDRLVAAGALSVLGADSRRRAVADPDLLSGGDLDAEHYHRLVWLVCAAIRVSMQVPQGTDPAPADSALTQAARRSLAAHDEGERPEAAAQRLAQALAPSPSELPGLLEEALEDRRIILFTALLARAMDADYDFARELVLSPAPERLWVALRGLDLPRPTIARIGYALCEADRRHDVEHFADMIDTIMALPIDEARGASVPTKLDREYRRALAALGREEVA